MAIERWDPFRDLWSMCEAMNRLLRDFWGRPLDSRLPDWGDIPVDVAEKHTAFVVRATIPGVRPEDIQVNVRGDQLTLWAESHNEQERKDERYVIRERYATSFYRALTLPSPVNTDRADARKEQACCHVRDFWRVSYVANRMNRLNESTEEGATHMSDRIGSAAGVTRQRGRAPWWVPLFNPIAKFLLAAGLPLGPNGLITIRGRKSGLPRTTPVAIIAVSGRRWIWAPWGEVQWVRNLRAAGRATITVRGRKDEVTATELDPTERVGYFRDILGPLARGIPFGVSFIRIADQVDLNRPVEAAEGRPVFELHPLR